MGIKHKVAALWGFLEATVFFIVPDVWLSRLALKKNQALTLATACTIGGALLGGLLMYLNGIYRYSESVQLLTQIPAIDQSMITTVKNLISEWEISALFIGPFLGIPYKIFAVEAAHMKIDAALFLAVSLPARAIRFTLVISLSYWIRHTLLSSLNQKQVTAIWGVFWLIFYGFYFWCFCFK